MQDQSTLFPADSPASRSVLPGGEEARKMTATSGQKCSASYKKSGRLGSLVRTLLESSIWYSTRCYLTWKVLATNQRRSLYRLVPRTPRTAETGYGLLLPTPRAKMTSEISSTRARDKNPNLEVVLSRVFGTRIGMKLQPAFVEWMMGYPDRWTELTDSKPSETQSSRKSHMKSFAQL